MDEFTRAAGPVWLSVPIAELVYIIVNDPNIFNALPGDPEIHPRVHVKVGRLAGATVLFQHWVDGDAIAQEPAPIVAMPIMGVVNA